MELLKGYNSVKIKKEKLLYDISVVGIAKSIIEITEKYKNSEFVSAIICKNWRWTSRQPKSDSEKSYDPYGFAKWELGVTLSDVEMVLSVKTLRLYLIESVKRCFPKVRNPEKWESINASYNVGGNEKTSSAFVSFVEDLFIQFNKIVKLSDDLNEYKQVVRNAVILGKEEAMKKRELVQAQRRLEANYNKTTNATDPTKHIATEPTKHIATDKKPSFNKTVPTINSWKGSEKKLVEKLVDSGIVDKSHFSKTETLQKEESYKTGPPNNKKSGFVKRKATTAATAVTTVAATTTVADPDDGGNWTVKQHKVKHNSKV
jgi:hypothetical protein